ELASRLLFGHRRVVCSHPALHQIHTIPLHDALPICPRREASRIPTSRPRLGRPRLQTAGRKPRAETTRAPKQTRPVASNPPGRLDRKSTRLNSSHVKISYAVFCLKKKKKVNETIADY